LKNKIRKETRQECLIKLYSNRKKIKGDLRKNGNKKI